MAKRFDEFELWRCIQSEPGTGDMSKKIDCLGIHGGLVEYLKITVNNNYSLAGLQSLYF